MAEIKKKIGLNNMRADFVPASIDTEKRTIEVVFSSDVPVRMYSWFDGAYDEILSHEKGHVRMQRLEQGAPVFDNHYRGGVKSQLGVIENPVIVGKKGTATLRFSKRADVEPIWNDIVDGIIRGISVGYKVHKYEEVNPNRTKEEIPVYRAIDWEPMEISLAPVQADINAQVRSENPGEKTHDVIIISERKQTDIKTTTMEKTPEQIAAENSAAEKARKEGAEKEKARVKDINEAVRKAGLKPEFAQTLIDGDKTIEEARAAIIEEFAKKDPHSENRNTDVTVGKEDSEKQRLAMEEGLGLRTGLVKDPKNGGENYRGYSLIEMARQYLERNGVKTEKLSHREIATKAIMGERAGMSTSDFPFILANVVNKQLRAAYEQAPRTFQPFCRQTTAKDFKEMSKVQLSGLVESFDKVVEGGEYKSGTMSEAKEAYGVEKYGRIIPITWETIINDDLDAFTRIPTAISQKAAQKQSDIVWDILINNPNMADGVALFHATHGNLAGVATAVTVAGLSAARAAMRKQKGLEGDFLNLSPAYIMVGPDKETEAQQLIQAVIMATKTADTNVFRGSLEIIVEPRITDNRWYLAANPSIIDTIEYAFLEGEGELFTEQRVGFDVDGLEVKARMVFGAKAIDYRGLYKNAGA